MAVAGATSPAEYIGLAVPCPIQSESKRGRWARPNIWTLRAHAFACGSDRHTPALCGPQRPYNFR